MVNTYGNLFAGRKTLTRHLFKRTRTVGKSHMRCLLGIFWSKWQYRHIIIILCLCTISVIQNRLCSSIRRVDYTYIYMISSAHWTIQAGQSMEYRVTLYQNKTILRCDMLRKIIYTRTTQAYTNITIYIYLLER